MLEHRWYVQEGGVGHTGGTPSTNGILGRQISISERLVLSKTGSNRLSGPALCSGPNQSYGDAGDSGGRGHHETNDLRKEDRRGLCRRRGAAVPLQRRDLVNHLAAHPKPRVSDDLTASAVDGSARRSYNLGTESPIASSIVPPPRGPGEVIIGLGPARAE